MAKTLSTEQLDALLTSVLSKTLPDILVKVLEKFEACLDRLADKFESKLDKIYGELHDTNVRIDVIEQKILGLEKRSADVLVTGTPAVPATTQRHGQPGTVDPSVQVLMAVEVEKMERAKRQRNVIITGLSQVTGSSDEELVLKLCEDHLTTKPRLIACQRIGRQAVGVPRRLKVTLDSDMAAENLILSSHLLRESHDDVVKKIFINRDLTPMEAKMAYDSRQSKRSSSSTRSNS